MNYLKSIKLLTVLLIFSLTLVSCGDDPASSDDQDPPELPTFDNFEPDVSYFEGDIPEESPASYAAIFAESFATTSQQNASNSIFFSDADKEDASFENGTWVWEYNSSMGGEPYTIVLESEERDDATHWSMTWSYTDGEQNVEYTMVEGWVSNDGSSGSWQFNTMDGDTGDHYPLMVTEWDWESETVGYITTSYYSEGNVATSYTYEQDGNEFNINLESTGDDDNLYIYWTEGGGGYYQEGENEANRECWNSNYVEVSC